MIESIVEFFTKPIGIVTIISFLSGMFGFIIVNYWIRPVVRYKRIKGHISRHLKNISMKIKESEPGASIDTEPETCNRLSSQLNTAFAADLPLWYRIMIANKKESPAEAVKDLMTLSNTKNPEHIQKRMEIIASNLRIN